MADDEIPRDRRWVIPLAVVGAVLLSITWFLSLIHISEPTRP